MINVNVRIESKGRKWFQVVILDTDRNAQLLIDESTKDFVIGQEFSFAADIEDKTDRKYGKLELTYISETISDEASKNNEQSDLEYARQCAVDELTYFLEHSYNPTSYVSRKQYRALQAKVAKFEIKEENKAEIAEAKQTLENKMIEQNNFANINETIDSLTDTKNKIVHALRNTGNDSIAEVLHNENIYGVTGEATLDYYIEKYKLNI